MKQVRKRELELNELQWWANWGELLWVGGDAYMLTSDEMPELFFNRGGLITCRLTRATMNELERRFQAINRPPAIMVYESCLKGVRDLAKAGYRKVDVMTVMKAARDIPSIEDRSILVDAASSAEGWSRAYLSAFYGDLELMPPVKKIVKRLLGAESTTLLEARLEGELAGTLALYRTDQLAGVYCVGTVRHFRGRGVAGALLARAGEIASSEGRTLFLQTLRSDDASQYYSKRGFVALYRKILFQKKG